MKSTRVIPAQKVDHDTIESFPYFAAHFGSTEDGAPEEGDDAPIAAGLSTPEEDARRLASADQIIYQKMQQAEREAQETARRGYEEGFKAGEAEGRTFGESQYRTHMQRLDSALQEVSASLAVNEKASQDQILALALATGEYLAGREIEQGIQTIRPLLNAVLAAHPFPESTDESGRPGVTVLMNPKDLEELGEASRTRPGVALREDPSLSRGSLRVESAIGVLDATVERRRARLMELIQRTQEREGRS